MAVAIEGDHDAGMAGAFADDLDVDAGEQMAEMGMSQAMQVDIEPRAPRQRGEGLGDAARAQRRAVRFATHQIGIEPRRARPQALLALASAVPQQLDSEMARAEYAAGCARFSAP